MPDRLSPEVSERAGPAPAGHPLTSGWKMSTQTSSLAYGSEVAIDREIMPSTRRRTSRTAATLASLALVATLAVPGTAWQSFLADGQGTARGEGVGPEVPGVAWVARLDDLTHDGRDPIGGVSGMGVSLALTHSGYALMSARDLSGPGGGGSSDRILVAVDTADGSEVWRADDISPDCGVVVDDDDNVWAMRIAAPGADPEIVSIDAADGTVTPVFTDTDTSDLDPTLTECDDTPMQLSADGSQLLLLHRTFGAQSGDWLRVFDLEPFAQTAIVRLVSTDTFGSFGGFDEVIRVAPAGSSAEGTIYLFERTEGASTECCDDDVNHVHALDLASLPATSNVTDAGIIDRTVELGVSQLWTGAIVLLDDEIILSGEEDLGDRVPAEGEDVNARNFRVSDDGDALTIAETSVGRPAADRDDGEHRWHLQYLNAGDDDTLVGRYRGSQGVVAGMDRETLAQSWVLEGYDCLGGQVIADVDGVTYFNDFCDEIIGAITADGRLKWTFDTEAEQPVGDSGDTVDLTEYGSFGVRMVTPEGRVIVTAGTPSTFDDPALLMFALDLGTSVDRASGDSRVETAVDISETTYPGGADIVVIAKAGDYPDALSGAPLAVAEGGPLLLTDDNVLSPAAAAEIDRLGATRAIMLGGDVALKPAVKSALEARGLTVERIAGSSRFDTAKLVSERIGATRAVVVEGVNPSPSRGWPDAVAASSWAASTGRAILLVRADALPDETADALDGMTDVVVVGGQVAVSSAVQSAVDAIAGDVSRIAGDTRYDTSVRVVERSLADGNTLDVVWLATGTGFADALTAGPAAALTTGVLLLVHGGDASGGTESLDFLRENRAQVGSVFLVGGNAAISPAVEDAINTALGR